MISGRNLLAKATRDRVSPEEPGSACSAPSPAWNLFPCLEGGVDTRFPRRSGDHTRWCVSSAGLRAGTQSVPDKWEGFGGRRRGWAEQRPVKWRSQAAIQVGMPACWQARQP